ncbi:MAG: carbohydrate ABC transporter permease [Desulfobacterales bacterium]|nr:MAG: carbohydrate ABC transporter permease [Desulfobacterales bacterium]
MEFSRLKPVWKKLGIFALRLMVFLFIAGPMYWMINTSFKPENEWVTFPPIWFPKEFTIDNYIMLFNPAALADKFHISLESAWPALLNSTIISVFATISCMVIGTMCAYSISRFRVGGNFFPMSILALRMFPPIAVALPILVLFSTLQLRDTYLGMVIAYACFNLPFSVWMMKSFIDDIPLELEEAAIIDGMTQIGAMLKVTIPLVKAGIAATALFIFILCWSEFLFAFILTDTEVATITVRLARYTTDTGEMYGARAALGVIATVPPVVIGYLIQNYLVRGLTFGAIKR